jgi:phosphoglycolate phosphatase
LNGLTPDHAICFDEMKLLLLWDIDGTLLNSGGAGMRALQAALLNAFDINGLLDDIDFAGRTDLWIMRRIFGKFGIDATGPNFLRYTDAYLEALPTAMAAGAARVLPGARELLQVLDGKNDVGVGLLTGNLRRGAQVKLSHHGLWDHFPFGAFADDSELRDELGPHALRRARERHGVDFRPERVWVIGDTPHDIACANAIGANSLAVATGGHTADQLASHGPTRLLPDLADPQAFWHALGE